MTHMRGQKKNITLFYADIFMLSAIHHFENHIALELIEKLFNRIIMKIDPLIGPANHLHDQTIVLRKDHFIANRRLEKLRILIDPRLKIERLKAAHLILFIFKLS